MKNFCFSILAFAALVGASPAMAQDASAPPATYTETRVSALEEQMRALSGRIEQVEYAVRRLDQSLQRLQSDEDARLTKLEAAAAAPPPPVIIPAQPSPPPPTQPPASADPAPNGTLGAIKLQDGKVTGGINNPKAPPLPTAPPDYGLTPAEQYDRALGLLRDTKYAEAEDAFKSYIDKNPKDKLIDNAKYWYGETLYVRGQFDASAVAFADAYQQNPQGTKAPDSLLKLAMSLGALNKTPDACVTLKELKTKYPNAAPATKSRAEDERTRLKCPAH